MGHARGTGNPERKASRIRGNLGAAGDAPAWRALIGLRPSPNMQRLLRGRPIPRLALLLTVPVAITMLITSMLIATAITAQDRTQIDQRILDKKNQLKQLQYEQEQIRLRLDRAKSAERQVLNDFERLAGSIRDTRKRIRAQRGERDGLIETIKQQDREISALDTSIAQNRERVGNRLVRLYRFSKARERASLFTLSKYKSIFKDSYYLDLLKIRDRQAVVQHLLLKSTVQQKRTAANANLKELESVQKRLSGELDLLREQESALRVSLRELRGNQTVYDSYLQDLQGVLDRMETAIAGLESRGAHQNFLRQSSSPASLKGKLSPPVAGRIVAAFGRRDPRYSLKKFQRGIVIRTEQDAPIVAVAPGKVVHAGPFRGYQELVVLDHGKGLFTVYGHLTDLRIARNAVVAGNTVLGLASYQPLDGGYSTYFELRVNGKPDDPVQWILPGSLEMDPQADTEE